MNKIIILIGITIATLSCSNEIDKRKLYLPDGYEFVKFVDNSVEPNTLSNNIEYIESLNNPPVIIEFYKINDPDGYSNLREVPNGKIIRKVYDGELFQVIGEDNNYKQVKLSDETIGFIHNSRVIKSDVKSIVNF